MDFLMLMILMVLVVLIGFNGANILDVEGYEIILVVSMV